MLELRSTGPPQGEIRFATLRVVHVFAFFSATYIGLSSSCMTKDFNTIRTTLVERNVGTYQSHLGMEVKSG